MGAETRIWAEVLVTRTEWREVYGVVLSDGLRMAEQQPGVIRVLRVQYEEPTAADEASEG